MTLRLLAACLLVGIVGFALAWSTWGLIQDHQRVAALWELEIRRAQAAQTPGK